MNKIDINSFNLNHLMVKLLNIQREFNRNDILLKGEKEVREFCLNKVKESFIYPLTSEKHLVNHLALFLLGNKDNAFDKIIDKK